MYVTRTCYYSSYFGFPHSRPEISHMRFCVGTLSIGSFSGDRVFQQPASSRQPHSEDRRWCVQRLRDTQPTPSSGTRDQHHRQLERCLQADVAQQDEREHLAVSSCRTAAFFPQHHSGKCESDLNASISLCPHVELLRFFPSITAENVSRICSLDWCSAARSVVCV